MELITYNVTDGVATITLNRPEVFHSFNRVMALSMHKALDEAEKDPAVRVVCITASGKAFCAGQDLKEATDEKAPPIEKFVNEHYNPMVRKIRALSKPVVAGVNGVAAGAGANLALMCDIVIATQSAKFVQAFSKIGLIPDTGGTYYLPRLIGLPRATALMMLGVPITADQAVAMGMIYLSVPDEEYTDTLQDTLNSMAQMPTKALALTKKALNYSMENTLEKQLALEAQLQSLAGMTADFKEGVAAFVEKRKPLFTGS